MSRSVLDDLDLHSVHLQAAAAVTASTRDTLLRAALAVAVWHWFRANQDKRVKVKVWIFRPSVRVAELRSVIEWIVGPDPAG